MTEPTVTLAAKTAVELFRNLLLFASTDDGRPTLCAVHLVATDGQMIGLASDSYALVEQTVKAETTGDPLTVSLAREDAETLTIALRQAVKTAEEPAVTFSTAGSDLVATIGVDDLLGTDLAVYRFSPSEGWVVPDGLWDTKPAKVGRIIYSGWQMARLGKVAVGGKKPGATEVRMRFGGEYKPVLLWIGDTIRGLLMPVRGAWPTETADKP